MKKAFVVMGFSQELRSVYLEAIRPALEESGFRCFRADEEAGPGNIPAEIIRELIRADIVIADVSDPSSNVYYELGISHCLGNKTITITQDIGNLPFDIKVFRAIEYEKEGRGPLLLKSQIKEALAALESRPRESGLNLVQDAGRDHFDLEGKIRENLEKVREERDRLREYAGYWDHRRKGHLQDNTPVADRVAEHVGVLVPSKSNRLLLCISGSGAIGKSTFAQLLADRIREIYGDRFSVDILPTDSYMLSRAERLARNIVGFNPVSHDLKQLIRDVEELLQGKEIVVRPYDHRTGDHPKEKVVKPSDVQILEGIYSFYPPLAPLSHSLRFYIYADPQRTRELKFVADLLERDHDIQTAFSNSESEYQAFAKYILPGLQHANFVLHVDGYWKYSGPSPTAHVLHSRAMSAPAT